MAIIISYLRSGDNIIWFLFDLGENEQRNKILEL